MNVDQLKNSLSELFAKEQNCFHLKGRSSEKKIVKMLAFKGRKFSKTKHGSA